MALTWAAAADKHGIAHEDAVHAMLNALYVETDFDAPRPPPTSAPPSTSAPSVTAPPRCWRSWSNPDPRATCTSSTSCPPAANTCPGCSDTRSNETGRQERRQQTGRNETKHTNQTHEETKETR